jgi:hypothetical protein
MKKYIDIWLDVIFYTFIGVVFALGAFVLVAQIIQLIKYINENN